MIAELALVAARRAEAALGPGSALAVIGAALETARDEPRRTLLLAGLGAATRAGDARAFAALTAEWARSGGGADEERGLSLVARLTDTRLELAGRLARAEVERARTAAGLLALGAIVEREGRGDAAALFEEAARMGEGTSLEPRARRALLAHVAPERAEAAEAALAASRDPREVLRLAPAALGAGRLYARVRVLDRLAELAAAATTRAAALRLALAHADLRGASLGALERDRVRSIAAAADAPAEVQRTLAGSPRTAVAEAAARSALMGLAPSSVGDRDVEVALRALAAAVSDGGSASLLLSALAAHPPTPIGWTAVLVGLSSPRARDAARACVERWINRGIAPPRGFGSLAAVLSRIGDDVLAERAWSWAVRANEPGAREQLGALLERAARAAYAAGDRPRARALLERSLAVDPDE